MNTLFIMGNAFATIVAYMTLRQARAEALDNANTSENINRTSYSIKDYIFLKKVLIFILAISWIAVILIGL